MMYTNSLVNATFGSGKKILSTKFCVYRVRSNLISYFQKNMLNEEWEPFDIRVNQICINQEAVS